MSKTRPLYRLYEQRLEAGLPPEQLPGHVGVLVDGNRRWAEQSGGSTADGHRAGAEKIIEFLGWCRDLEIPHVTLYVLSTENLKRPAEELGPLLEIIAELMSSLQTRSLCQVQAVGALEMLPDDLRGSIRELERATAGNEGPHLNIAVGYGGRQEIVDAVREIFAGALERGEDVAELVQRLSADDISEHLYTRGQPDPDLLIRTSGEQRLSGFLMWQSAYSEYLLRGPVAGLPLRGLPARAARLREPPSPLRRLIGAADAAGPRPTIAGAPCPAPVNHTRAIHAAFMPAESRRCAAVPRWSQADRRMSHPGAPTAGGCGDDEHHHPPHWSAGPRASVGAGTAAA